MSSAVRLPGESPWLTVVLREIVHMWAWAGNYDDLLRQALQPPKEALVRRPAARGDRGMSR